MTCGFSVAHYLETINAYRDQGYIITPVGEYFHNRTYDKQILLRHDVDLSLDYALDMALLEKDNDIHATYYILLSSGCYNPPSWEGRESIKSIKEAGHEIGLHIDTRHYLGRIEFDMLGYLTGYPVETWCQHLITITPPMPYPTSCNAFDTTGYKYLSDSGMNWREGCWCNKVNIHDKLQILIHPEWTMVSPDGEADRWEILGVLEERAKSTAANSFRDFRKLVQEYMQVVTA